MGASPLNRCSRSAAPGADTGSGDGSAPAACDHRGVTSDADSPLANLLDLMVYAPLGVLSIARDQFPALVERGRATVQTSGAGYRAVGEFTAEQLASRVRGYVEEVRDLLVAMGVVPDASHDSGRSTDTTGADVAQPDGTEGAARHQEPVEGVEAAIETVIVGYDAMTASEIVPLLATLTAAQRTIVAEHEQMGRARRTILGRLERLQELDGNGNA